MATSLSSPIPLTFKRLSTRASIASWFLTNNSYEYWGRTAALTHVTADGKADAPLSPDTRYYFMAGVQHGPGTLPITKPGKYQGNPVDHRPVHRALLVALQGWLKDGTAPPPSVYPKLAAGQLTPIEKLGLQTRPES